MPYPTSDLSSENVLRDVHDQESQTLRVSAQALVPPGLEVEISAADGDNIAISDGTDTLAVNPDGSINVVITTGTGQSFEYNEVTSVGASALTTILTYNASSDQILRRIVTSGTNIAEYTVLINGGTVTKQRTYFTNLNLDLCMESISLETGDILEITVIHTRPDLGDFNATAYLENQ